MHGWPRDRARHATIRRWPREPRTGMGTQRLTPCVGLSFVNNVFDHHTRDTHPWTGKAARAVDSAESEVRSAAVERAVGHSGALTRSASAIRVPGCMAGREIGPGTRRSGAGHEIVPARDASALATRSGPARDDRARHATIRLARRAAATRGQAPPDRSTTISWWAATVRVSPATAGRIQDPAASHRLASSPRRAGG